MECLTQSKNILKYFKFSDFILKMRFLKFIRKVGISDFESTPYKEWILKQAGQIVLLVSQINFNKRVVASLNSTDSNSALNEYYQNLIGTINMAASTMSKELLSYKTLTIEALLTIEVHSRDILSDLIQNKVSLCFYLIIMRLT